MARGPVILGLGIIEERTGLIGEVHFSSLQVFHATDNGPVQVDSLRGDGAILHWYVASRGTVVWLTHCLVQAVLQLAKVRSTNNPIGSSVQRIAGRNCQVDNLSFTLRRVVVESLLHEVSRKMSNLLE